MREVELSRELGISRIPLREALCRLVGEGLVVMRPNRGAVVASLDASELLQIALVCRLLEGHLLRAALPNLNAGVLRRAGAQLARLDRTEDLLAWARINWAFHSALYGAARQPLVLDLVSGLRAKAERFTLLLVRERKQRRALNREHRAILAACRKRDTRLALELLERHLSGAHDEVLRLMEAR